MQFGRGKIQKKHIPKLSQEVLEELQETEEYIKKLSKTKDAQKIKDLTYFLKVRILIEEGKVLMKERPNKLLNNLEKKIDEFMLKWKITETKKEKKEKEDKDAN